MESIVVDEIARSVDRELFALEMEIDWLARLSPLDNVARWHAFRESGFRTAPPLTYRHFDLNTDDVRQRLDALAAADVEQPSLRILLCEKRDELADFVTLLEARDTPAFTTASVALFGGTDPTLLADALGILDTVPDEEPTGPQANAADMVAEAERVRSLYAQIDPDLAFDIRIVADSDAALVVHHGDLLVSTTLSIPHARIRALVAHEVGVHVLTRHNGRRQPLRLFESGFAHYDLLQEGLATFCEFLAGCLPPSRLRILAARVVAADLAVRHEPLEAIFEVLHAAHGIAAEAAFAVAVRAKRGGGLTKDAVYLAGLRDVLALVQGGSDLSLLFLGKYALRQRHLIVELVDDGVLRPAALLPECLTSSTGRGRLDAVSGKTIRDLHHQEQPS